MMDSETIREHLEVPAVDRRARSERGDLALAQHFQATLRRSRGMV